MKTQHSSGNSLAVQRLQLLALTAEGLGPISCMARPKKNTPKNQNPTNQPNKPALFWLVDSLNEQHEETGLLKCILLNPKARNEFVMGRGVGKAIPLEHVDPMTQKKAPSTHPLGL